MVIFYKEISLNKSFGSKFKIVIHYFTYILLCLVVEARIVSNMFIFFLFFLNCNLFGNYGMGEHFCFFTDSSSLFSFSF